VDSREQFSAAVAFSFMSFEIPDSRKHQCLFELPEGCPERRRRFLYDPQAFKISDDTAMKLIFRELSATLHKVTIDFNCY